MGSVDATIASASRLRLRLESSGLVMIETDRSKAPAAPQGEEPVHLGRPRRERPKDAPQDETLEQVETRK